MRKLIIMIAAVLVTASGCTSNKSDNTQAVENVSEGTDSVSVEKDDFAGYDLDDVEYEAIMKEREADYDSISPDYEYPTRYSQLSDEQKAACNKLGESQFFRYKSNGWNVLIALKPLGDQLLITSFPWPERRMLALVSAKKPGMEKPVKVVVTNKIMEEFTPRYLEYGFASPSIMSNLEDTDKVVVTVGLYQSGTDCGNEFVITIDDNGYEVHRQKWHEFFYPELLALTKKTGNQKRDSINDVKLLQKFHTLNEDCGLPEFEFFCDSTLRAKPGFISHTHSLPGFKDFIMNVVLCVSYQMPVNSTSRQEFEKTIEHIAPYTTAEEQKIVRGILFPNLAE